MKRSDTSFSGAEPKTCPKMGTPAKQPRISNTATPCSKYVRTRKGEKYSRSYTWPVGSSSTLEETIVVTGLVEKHAFPTCCSPDFVKEEGGIHGLMEDVAGRGHLCPAVMPVLVRSCTPLM
jgi:hypothetical protein